MRYPIILLTLFLSACSSTETFITAEQCGTQNWKKLGYSSAMKGESIRVFDQVKKICNSQQASLAQPIFVDGYSDGLIEYCTFDNGFKIGESGLTSDSICPLELRKEFLAGYRQAKLIRDQTLAEMEREKRMRESMPNSANTPRSGNGN